MTPTFEPGQKVICINDRFPGSVHEWGDQLPVCDRVYTVRRVAWLVNPEDHDAGWALLLVELNNPDDRLYFCARRFRHYEEQVEGSANTTVAAICQ